MNRSLWQVVILPLTVSVALADAPLQSIRPMPRPAVVVVVSDATPSIRPRPRPAGLGLVTQQTSTAAANPPRLSTSLKGSVCNNPNIKGKTMPPIMSRTKGCAVKEPVQVTSIDGVRLNPPATINCAEATALASWIDKGVQPAFNNQVVQLNVADSYSCRPRNNVPGAKISEHGSGNAIDISGFVLSTGRTQTVAANYNSQMRRAQKAGCGTFHTILGPGSDGYHESHLHFDVAPYRGRPYCR